MSGHVHPQELSEGSRRRAVNQKFQKHFFWLRCLWNKVPSHRTQTSPFKPLPPVSQSWNEKASTLFVHGWYFISLGPAMTKILSQLWRVWGEGVPSAAWLLWDGTLFHKHRSQNKAKSIKKYSLRGRCFVSSASCALRQSAAKLDFELIALDVWPSPKQARKNAAHSPIRWRSTATEILNRSGYGRNLYVYSYKIHTYSLCVRKPTMWRMYIHIIYRKRIWKCDTHESAYTDVSHLLYRRAYRHTVGYTDGCILWYRRTDCSNFKGLNLKPLNTNSLYVCTIKCNRLYNRLYDDMHVCTVNARRLYTRFYESNLRGRSGGQKLATTEEYKAQA